MSKRTATVLKSIVVGCCLVGGSAVLAVWVVSGFHQAQKRATRTVSPNNLKQIGLALHRFEERHGYFPAGTRFNEKLAQPEDRFSWVVDILPDLDENPVYEAILNAGAVDKTLQKKPARDVTTHLAIEGNGGFNNTLYTEPFQQKLDRLLNPNVTLRPDPNGYGLTSYVGIAGVGEDAAKLKIDDPKAGIFGYDRQTKVSDIKDGLFTTMMVAEIYRDFGPWAQGGRATVRGLTKKPYINGPDGIGRGPGAGAALVLMADGSVRTISENIQPEVFEALATMAGSEAISEF